MKKSIGVLAAAVAIAVVLVGSAVAQVTTVEVGAPGRAESHAKKGKKNR